MTVRPYGLGIAFGGGAARGFFHLGVLKALSEAGIEADCVAGTSVGSIFTALFAAGLTPEQVEALAGMVRWRQDVFDLKSSFVNTMLAVSDHLLFRKRRLTAGLLESSRISDFVNRAIEGRTFSSIKPLVLTATDIHSGEKIQFASPAIAGQLARQLAAMLPPSEDPAHAWRRAYLTRDVVVPFEDVGRAVRASCCFPGVMSSFTVECPDVDGGVTTRILNDGGICEQVPVKPLRALGCRRVLAVHLGYVPQFAKVDHMFALQSNTVQFIARAQIADSLQLADYVIYDPRIEGTSMVRLSPDLITMGYEITRDQMPAIRAALALEPAAAPAQAHEAAAEPALV